MFASRKEGEQRRNGYKNMILLYYNFIDEERDYLNFTKLNKKTGHVIRYLTESLERSP